MNDPALDEQFIRDNDSLYAMPLRIVPFATPALQRGRLIKNTKLEPAVELFRFDDGTNGHILISEITPKFGAQTFGWKSGETHPDLALLKKIAALTSYDVYSLRILFRELGFPVESMKYLVLSQGKKQELKDHMDMFTRPLIKRIYGGDQADEHDSDSIMKLYSDPNKENALKMLRMLAEVLDTPVNAIPAFLESFGDTYLSFCYYQQCLETVDPLMVEMFSQIDELQQNWQMKQDANLMRNCQKVTNDLKGLTAITNRRFDTFRKLSDRIWENISAEGFRKIETSINSSHTTIGGVLCGVGIKMNAWHQKFPSAGTGGLLERGNFILSNMLPGMDQIKKIELDARANSEVEIIPVSGLRPTTKKTTRRKSTAT